MVRHGPRKPRSKIAARRQQIGLSQKELSELSGLSMSTIQRLDWRQTENPPIRHLANVALVLDVALLDIVEDEWTEWTVLDESAAEAPPRGHWLPDRE